MAPTRSNNRRGQRARENERAQGVEGDGESTGELFLEPMMGTPLPLYIEKDVEDRDELVELVVANGGIVAPSYSAVPYIIVDPHKESGQNLYRQYVGKKGKMVLDARWIRECVKAGALQTYQTNFAGCKVNGNEQVGQPEVQSLAPTTAVNTSPRRSTRQQTQTTQAQVQAHPQGQPMQVQAQVPVQAQMQVQPQPPAHEMTMQTGQVAQDQAAQPQPPPHMIAPQPVPAQGAPYPHAPFYPYPVMHPHPGVIHPAAAAPPQSWQAANGIAPQQTHMYDQARWDEYHRHMPPPNAMIAPQPGYDYRYRDDQAQAWGVSGVGGTNEYYQQPQYEQTYEQPQPYASEPQAGPSTSNDIAMADDSERTRGRKKNRPPHAQPAPPASSLVVKPRNPAPRSPTPPTRVIKSTYGGNLFTADDIDYLKKYIDYCQEQGLVLSLREICERIAVKAPHHTFYSWRRYCNKHQIRLGGYAMDVDRSPSPGGEGDEDPVMEEPTRHGVGAAAIRAARQRAQQEALASRTRSPTPPRSLYRSTTGKGVAFTEEDVTFLVRFLAYRKSQARLDMVVFWKDVAAKAPHHSRASWMKFWRRHKHELEYSEATGDEDPLPVPPEKKMRYSKEDDVLLAQFFASSHEGTSDKVFQDFSKLHPHHPWKGWQEHHRIHKAKIDHMIRRIQNGQPPEEETA
ncbi:hypothetical protein OE88DRAFT_1733019 [Heliocybe sulcata]|uniref:BRCT domain-containing protein n=1 Tax=Heliocybe sulcata TaxID=5364 RepID=A0A5C3NBF7_9AGAM|nr:hypothetical protein OE88DRAFT_1733019 [Heliocybe sulcata]